MARTPENLAFAQRLKQALTRHPKRIETPSELAVQFNLHHLGNHVTNQAVQKWMAGDNKPSLDKIETLAEMCSVSVQWLRHGIAEYRSQSINTAEPKPTFSHEPNPAEREMLARYRLLSEYQQKLVVELIEQISLDRAMWQEAPPQTC